MDGGRSVNREYGADGWQARLLNALKGIEDNIVFRAWCLSRGREVRRRWWRHPAVTPFALLVLTLLLFANLERINHLPGGFYLSGHDWVGILAVAWTVPLVFSSILDALKMMGRGRIGVHWDGFVGQLKVTTVDDNEFLVAAFRICWPRLLLAAVGAVVALWLLAAVMAQYYPDDGGYSDMLMYGTPVAGLLVFNGALAGITIVLLGLCLGRGARTAWVLVMGAGAWCAVLILNATLNLSYSLPLPNGDRVYLVDYPGNYYMNQVRPLEVLDPQGLVHVLGPLSVILLGVVALALFTAARHPGLRAYLAAGWPLLLPLAGWLGYQGLAALGHALGTLGVLSRAGNLEVMLWFASLTGFNPGLFNPAELELGWSGPALRSARMEFPDLWFRHLVFTWTQLGFIGVLYYYALDTVRRWRRGED